MCLQDPFLAAVLSDEDVVSLPLQKRLELLKCNVDSVLKRANTESSFITKMYFGMERRVIDETQFADEIHSINTLLAHLYFSEKLHDTFDGARKRLTALCSETSSNIAKAISDFPDLNVKERLSLANELIASFSAFFFKDRYTYVNPETNYEVGTDRSFHRNFPVDPDQTKPRPSLIKFSDNVIGAKAKLNIFLNLVLHEGCVHAPLYQLQQSYQSGWIDPQDPLYQDSEFRFLYKKMKLTAPFLISSVYPNFLEESIAFRQAALFVSSLGLPSALDGEDNCILLSTNRHKPYKPS